MKHLHAHEDPDMNNFEDHNEPDSAPDHDDYDPRDGNYTGNAVERAHEAIDSIKAEIARLADLRDTFKKQLDTAVRDLVRIADVLGCAPDLTEVLVSIGELQLLKQEHEVLASEAEKNAIAETLEALGLQPLALTEPKDH